MLNDSASDPYWARSSGGQKNQHQIWLRRFEVTVAAADVTKWATECCSQWSWKWWLKFLSRRFWCNSCCCCCCWCCFEAWRTEVLLEWGSHSALSRLALITINLKKNYTGHSESNFISAQISKRCTEFTRSNTLPLLRYFALEARELFVVFWLFLRWIVDFLFWAPHCLSTTLFEHRTVWAPHCLCTTLF